MRKANHPIASGWFHRASYDPSSRRRRARSRRAAVARRYFRPLVEQFEQRQLLAGVWDGGGGDNNWNTPTNWDDDQLPGSSTNVVIGAAFSGITITSANAVSVKSVNCAASLAITASTFSITNDSTFNNAVNVSGTGVLTLSAASMTVSGNGTLTNAATLDIRNTTLAATLPVSNQGTIIARSVSAINGTFTTSANSLLHLESDGSGASFLTIGSSFTNNGTIELTDTGSPQGATLIVNGTLTNAAGHTIDMQAGANGPRTLSAQLNNQGTLNVNGRLTLDRPSGLASLADNNAATGVINVTGADMTVRLSRASTSDPVPSFTTSGTINIGSGRIMTVDGGGGNTQGIFNYNTPGTIGGLGTIALVNFTTANFAQNFNSATTSLTVQDSTVDGPGTLTNGATLTLQRGTLAATLPVINQGLLLARGASAINGTLTTAAGSTLRLAEDGSFAGPLTIGSSFTNNGTIELTDVGSPQGATLIVNGTLTNAATIDMQAGADGPRTLSAQLNNQGTLNVNQRLTLDRPSGLTSVADNNAASGVINVTGGDLTVNLSRASGSDPVPSFATSGTINIATGRTLKVQGVGAPGTFNFTAGTIGGQGTLALINSITANFTPNFGSATSLTVQDSTVNGPGTLTNGATLALQRGALGANLPVINQGLLIVSGPSALSGTFTTAFGSTLRLSGDGGFGPGNLTVGSSFTNNGTIELTEAGSPQGDTLTVNGTLTNAAGHIIDIQVGADGPRTLNAQLNNQGTLNVNKNLTMNAAAAAHTNSGTINIPTSRTLTVTSGTLTNQAPGALNLNSATITATLANEGLIVAHGTSAINGTFTTAAGSALRAEGAGGFGTGNLTVANGFTNNGAIELTNSAAGQDAILTVSTGTLTNAQNRTIDILPGVGGGSGTLNAQLDNQGTLNVNAPLTINKASATHTNSGTINVTGGNLTLTQSGTTPSFSTSGTINISSGRTFTVNGGTFNFNNPGTIGGGGTLAFSTTTANFTADFNSSTTNLTLNSSTLNGPGTLTNATGRTLELFSSTLGANLPVINQGLILVKGQSFLNGTFTTVAGSTLRMEGAGFFASGSLTVANGFTNNGLIELTNSSSFQDAVLIVSAGTLTNAATIDSLAGAGNGSRILRASLDNQGILNVNQSLTMDKSSAVHTNSGTINVTGGDLVVTQSGASPSFSTSGTLNIGTGRTLTVSGPAAAQSTFNYTAGTIGGGGTLALVNTTANFTPDFTNTTTNLTLNSAVMNGPGTLTNATGRTLELFSSTLGANLPVINQGLIVVKGQSFLNGTFTTVAGSTLRMEGAGSFGTGSLTVANGFTNNGLIELTNSASFQDALLIVNGTLTNAAGHVIDILAGVGGSSGTLRASLDNQGTLNVGAPLTMDKNGAVDTNSGTINVSGGNLSVNNAASFSNSGVFNISSSRTFTISNASFSNFAAGTLTGGTYNIAGTFKFSGAAIATNAATIVLDGAGSQIVDQFNANAIFNSAALNSNAAAGSFTITNGRNLNAAGALSNAGNVTIGSGSTLSTAAGNYTQTAGSTVLAATTSVLDPAGIADIQGGSLSGLGTVLGNVQNAGQAAPGLSPGIILVTGDYNQAAAGALNIEIGGTNAVTPEFDQLVVSGAVTLGGALNVSLINGFAPHIGDSFRILNKTSTGGIGGAFTNAADGATLFVGNFAFHVTYAGGTDNNDVVLIAINIAPTLNPITDPAAILEDAGQQIINLGGITAGGVESQALTVTATSSNPGLIPNPVAVTYTSPNATGSLSYTPVANQFGSAVITVTVHDDGGTANGGVDTFSRTFTVTVTPVNDPPTLDAVSNPAAILEDAGQQTINLSGINAGPFETQTLTVTATSSNLTLIPNPTPNYSSPNPTGSLSYTPVANQSGTAVITVTVTDDGGTLNGGIDAFSRTFTVTVTPVNDAPTLDPIANPAAILEDAGQQTISLSGITAGPIESQVLTITAASSNPSLIPTPSVSYSSPNPTGALSYTPVGNQSGTAVITVTVTDDGGTLNGGIDAFSRTFTVTVTPVNDAPTLDPIANPAEIRDDAGTQTINLSGISAGPSETQSLTVSAVSNNPSLIANPGINYTSPNAIGSLSYSPILNQSGTAVITVTVNDDGGTLNGGVNSVSQTFTVTVFTVNDPPTFDPIANPAAVLEDAGQQTINLTGISAGPAESQSLTITAVSSNPGLIPTPAVNYSSPNTSGSLSYTPVGNQSGTAVITVTVADNGGTAHGGVDSFSRTFTVAVTPVNDAPSLGPIANPAAIFEDASLQTIDLSGISAGPNESQSLTITAVSSNPGLIPDPAPSYTSPNPTGSLSYQPVANQSGTAVITVTVHDDGGSADSGVDTVTRTFTVVVNPVNDAPTLDVIPDPTPIPQSSGLQTINLSDITAGPGETQTLTVTASSGNPALIPNPTVSYTSANPTGSLSYTPAAGLSGTAVITVTVTDSGGTADGGVDTFTRTFRVTVAGAGANRAPTLDAISNPAAILEDATTQTISLSGISAGLGESQLLTVTATSSNPGLIPNSIAVAYTSPSATGSLTYKPVANQSGTAVITVTVKDDGGTADGGIDSLSRTFTVTVAPVNDAPTLDAIANPAAISEDAGLQTINLPGISTGAGEAQSLTLSAVSSNPGLIPNPIGVNYTSPGATGSLSYAPVANRSGAAIITVTVTDDGGTTDGGVNAVTQAFTVTVTAVNDAPTLNPIGNPASILEDAGLQTISFSGISAGPDESQILSVTATSNNAGLIPNPVAVSYTSLSAGGSLSYTPVGNQSGTAVITVTVTDDGATDNSGVNSVSRTFTVTVTPVNDAPAFDAIPNPAAILEDASQQTINLSGISAGPNETQFLTVTATSSNPGLIPNPIGVNYTSPGATGSLSYAPVANQSGAAIITVTVTDDGGTTDGGVNAVTQAFTVTVTAVNDAPTLSAISNPAAILEDAGLQTINLGGITAGGVESQALTVTATSSNPGLIPNPVAVTYTSPNPTSSLSYSPVANQFGTAVITVTVHDDGGTANGGVDTFSRTFTVMVTPVNDPPTLDTISNPAAILEDAGLQTINLSGIAAGPNETQVLTVTATSSNAALIPNPIAVNYTSAIPTGSLSYTPVANQSGTAVITVTVTDDGGTTSGGVNSVARNFTVSVTPVNDTPTLNAIPDPAAILEDAGLQTINLAGITAGTAETQTLTVTATSSNPALIPNPIPVSYTSPNSTGSLSYAPLANQSGTALITVTVTDNGGTNNGGVSSISRTFTVNVTPVNDAPTLDSIPDPPGLSTNAGVQTINFAGISSGGGESQTLVVTATSSNPALIPNPITVTYASPDATGSLSFTPAANQSGTALISVTVSDGGGTTSGGIDSITRTFTVTVATPAPTEFDLSRTNRAAIVDDVANPGKKALLVVGGASGDSLFIGPRPSNQIQIRVKQTGNLLGIFAGQAFGRIVVFGLNGNDTIAIDSRVTKSVELHGGPGNDSLSGGAGRDLLFGEEGNDRLVGRDGNDKLDGGDGNDDLFGGGGNDVLLGGLGNDKLYGEAGTDLLLGGLGDDQLFGSTGRDVLIGCAGADRLSGQEDDDLLIGGEMIHDNHDDALKAILAEWNSSHSFSARVKALTPLLNSSSVTDDLARDELRGDGSRDWILDFALADVVRGFDGNVNTGDRRN
jgi:RTX calcium-binding nonapeptide repeat (4 copies)